MYVRKCLSRWALLVRNLHVPGLFPRRGGVGRRSKAATYVEYTGPKMSREL